jgi:hypothetical protein
MFSDFVGQSIESLELEENGTILVIKTNKYKYTFHAEGDCCAVAYVLEPDKEDLQSFLGHEIVQATSSGVSVDKYDDYGQTDTEFYTFRTHNGDLTLELRTEHNGYYSGWLTLAGREEIWPVFDDIRKEAKKLM